METQPADSAGTRPLADHMPDMGRKHKMAKRFKDTDRKQMAKDVF
jgi:hypothetical protein